MPSPSYHGQPLLKAPVWTWEIPVYFFIGGAAGVSAVLAAAAGFAGADPTLVRDAHWLALTGAIVSPILLVSDLGRPERFLYMLRVFKRRSPMSVGVWTLVVFSAAAAAAMGADLAQGRSMDAAIVRWIGTLGDIVAALTGAVLATYTGVLLGVSAIPAWASQARSLPWQFGLSSLGAAVSVLEIVGHRDRSLNMIGLAAAAAKTVFLFVGRADLRSAGPGPRSITIIAGDLGAGPIALILRIMSVITAWGVLGIRPSAWRALAATVTIAGSLTLRVGWIQLGRTSVADPAPALGGDRRG